MPTSTHAAGIGTLNGEDSGTGGDRCRGGVNVRRSVAVLCGALTAAVTMTGCHGHDPAVRSVAQRSASPTTSAAAPGLTVGVIRKSGALAIYRIGRDRHARPVAEFTTPRPGQRVSSVSFTSGPEPR